MSTSIIPEGMNGSKNNHEPRVHFKEMSPKRNAKKEMNTYVAMGVGSVIGLMIVATAFRERASRGPCSYDSVYRRIHCKTKELTEVPKDLPEVALALHFGTTEDKNRNFFDMISAENFTRFTQLKELVLIKCGIEVIEGGTFAQRESLTKLDLRFNKIQSLSKETFFGLVSLEYLYLSNNPIYYVGDGSFQNIRIDQLVLGNNPTLSYLSDNVFEGSVIRSLALNRCNLTTVDAQLLHPISSSLKEFRWTNNAQPVFIANNMVEGIKLEVLSLADNGISDPRFLKHVSTDELYLDGNILANIEFEKYPNLHKLKVLSLQRNNIQALRPNMFDIFDDLRELALDGNQFTTLDVELFSDLDDLKNLRLSSNLISQFIGNFSKDLKHVCSLNLDNNRIQSLPSEMGSIFSHISNITIGSNPLHCNCEMRWFRIWLEKNKHRITDVDNLKCVTPTTGKFIEMQEHELKCRPPLVINATVDEDGMGLVCLAEGDPSPDVSWTDPVGKETGTKGQSRAFGRTAHRVTLIKEGNYSCLAQNVAGADDLIIDSREVKRFARLFGQSGKIKFLETPKGFLLTAFLVGILLYVFKHQ